MRYYYRPGIRNVSYPVFYVLVDETKNVRSLIKGATQNHLTLVVDRQQDKIHSVI